MQLKKLMDFPAAQLTGQRVFIRADFNVPQDDAGKNEGIAHHAKMQARGAAAPSPSGTICAKCFSADATRTHKAIKDVGGDDLIVDLGTDSAVALARTLQTAGTIVWNGPVGVFEFEAFSGGTRALAQAIANSPAYSIAGNGDTVAAINAFGIADQIDYFSTAGGAFLDFLEGKTLPSIEVLKQRTSLC